MFIIRSLCLSLPVDRNDDVKMMMILTSFFLLISFDYLQTFPINTLIIFGDGNSDTGNVYNLTNQQWPLVPPYYQGRFCNGPIWIDYLNISKIFNYAFADAMIDNYNFIGGTTGPDQIIVPGIREQIVMYLSMQNLVTSDLSKQLHIIWSSGNEYFVNSSISADIVVYRLLSAVSELITLGITQILLVNLPPLQSYPRMNNNVNLRYLVNQHNDYLRSNITFIRFLHPEIWIDIFDLHSLITDLLINDSMKNFTQLESCWTLNNYSIDSQCSNPDKYIFLDQTHFTSVIHRQIAASILPYLSIRSSSNCRISCKYFLGILLILFVRR